MALNEVMFATLLFALLISSSFGRLPNGYNQETYDRPDNYVACYLVNKEAYNRCNLRNLPDPNDIDQGHYDMMNNGWYEIRVYDLIKYVNQLENGSARLSCESVGKFMKNCMEIGNPKASLSRVILTLCDQMNPGEPFCDLSKFGF